jgi:hypothetical protein
MWGTQFGRQRRERSGGSKKKKRVEENISFRLLPYKNTYCTKVVRAEKKRKKLRGHNTKKKERETEKKKTMRLVLHGN